MKINKIKDNKGITMIALVITMIIIIILANISVNEGTKALKMTELENIRTNMLLIQTKAKEYVETANFKLGKTIDSLSGDEKNNRIESAKENLKGSEVIDGSMFSGNIGITTEQIENDNKNYVYYYRILAENLEEMGLKDIKSDKKNGWFIIKYDIKNSTTEIYNTKGLRKDYQIYYALSEIKNL